MEKFRQRISARNQLCWALKKLDFFSCTSRKGSLKENFSALIGLIFQRERKIGVFWSVCQEFDVCALQADLQLITDLVIVPFERVRTRVNHKANHKVNSELDENRTEESIRNCKAETCQRLQSARQGIQHSKILHKQAHKECELFRDFMSKVDSNSKKSIFTGIFYRDRHSTKK